MKYLCLVFTDPKDFEGLSPSDLESLDDASLADDADLLASGHLIVATPLQQGAMAVTVRVRDGRMSATNGPFAEATEILGGFMYIEARDLNEAIAIAARSPIARYASIEIRPALDLVAKVAERPAR
jgi:hypothetical protein